MKLRLSTLAAALCMCGALCFSASGVTTSYHIGNSLTHDSQPENLELLASFRELDHEVGFHIRGSWSLQNILANPDEVSIPSNEFGTFANALPNNAWDIVTIQPHPNNEPFTTLGLDVESILSFIDLARTNPANANTNFYIYQGWPQRSNSYQNAWTMSSPDKLSTQMSRSREYYSNLIERVRAETDANVYMIPTGEVLYELDVRMRAGEIPGYTSVNQLYRDNLHLTYDVGRFVAGVATFSTMLGQYPNGLDLVAAGYAANTPLSTAQTELFLDAIREVLDGHTYSGVRMPAPLRADFNGNLTVDEQDLPLLQASYGVVNPYDADRDGDVDGRDFLKWQRDYHVTLTHQELENFEAADLNDDGFVSSLDVQHWRDSFGVNGGGDVDGDGDSDGRDFLAWQRAYPSNPSDANHDYRVDRDDLEFWHQSFGYVAAADANGDGVVDDLDYDVWQSEQGLSWTFPYAFSAPPLASEMASAGALTVPEPEASYLTVLLLTFSVYVRVPRQLVKQHSI